MYVYRKISFYFLLCIKLLKDMQEWFFFFLELEEYCEWVVNEVFVDSRRYVFVMFVDLNQLKQIMILFVLEVLDENVYEIEEKMVDKFYLILNLLKKK